jgi:hypothetical protein
VSRDANAALAIFTTDDDVELPALIFAFNVLSCPFRVVQRAEVCVTPFTTQIDLYTFVRVVCIFATCVAADIAADVVLDRRVRLLLRSRYPFVSLSQVVE